MDEFVIRLSMQAMNALATGETLVLDVDDVRMVLRCDDAAVELFKDSVQRALLHQLPVSPTHH